MGAPARTNNWVDFLTSEVARFSDKMLRKNKFLKLFRTLSFVRVMSFVFENKSFFYKCTKLA